MSSSNDGDASTSAQSDTKCSEAQPLFDPARACSPGTAIATGLCETATYPAARGLEGLCAVSPDGRVFFLTTSNTQHWSGDGWTFGAGPIAELQQLPLADNKGQGKCDVALPDGSGPFEPAPCR